MPTEVMVLTNNRLGITAKCVMALLKYSPDDVILSYLDNNSTDGTDRWLSDVQQHHPERMNVMLSPRNNGVSGGRQMLLDRSVGSPLVFLDNDAIVGEGWLGSLSAPLDDPAIGIAGPAGHMIRPDWKWYIPHPQAGEVDVVSGYCQIFRRDVLDAGCRLDLNFGRYWHEDSAWCLDIRALGYKVWCTGKIPVQHIFSGTGDDGTGAEKQAYLAQKYRGRGLIKAESG